MAIAQGIWSEWMPIRLPPDQLQCRVTLMNGQSFAWSYDDDQQIYTGVIEKTVVRICQRESERAQFCIGLDPHQNRDLQISNAQAILDDYLHASVDLAQLYSVWINCDKRFADVAINFIGVRLLRQNPIECLFSFICSSNNHIGRITLMLSRLRDRCGEPVLEMNGVTFRAFPTISSLAELKEKDLRLLGFGYRAKFIRETAIMLHEGRSENFLHSLRTEDVDTIRSELCKFVGVGRKVADCVALFSLDQYQVVPVDTHVFQIAMNHYRCHLKGLKSVASKTLSEKVYVKISSMFTDVFGKHAGWAHTILFTSDLAIFKKDITDPKPSKRHRSF